MTLGEYLLLFSSVILGGGIGMLVNSDNIKRLQLFLSFSGAYILSICVLDIMPSVFCQGVSHVGIYIILGFLIQLILERFSDGVEHGHIHVPHQKIKRYTFMVMLGLCTHAFIEGLPLGGHIHNEAGHNHNLFWGVILHKAPAAFALMLLLRKSQFTLFPQIGALIVFALMSPLAAKTMAIYSSGQAISLELMTILNAVVIGSFLHIATTILFESNGSSHHKIPLPKFLAILIGLGTGILAVLL